MVAQEAAGGTSQRRRQPLGARPQGQPDPEGIIEGGCRGVQGRVSFLQQEARLGLGPDEEAMAVA